MLPRGSEFQHPQETCTTELIKLPCLVMRVRAQSLFTSASDLGSVQMSHCESTPCVISSSQVQGPEHPSPGRPYIADGFPRVAYLPDTPDGCRALHGLYLAWEQRLLFTVGTSMSSGFSNCVTWNDIHLKTYKSGPNHSYPDPNFLSNLMQVPA